MGPNFKVNSKFILFALFITLHFTSRFTVADLPNKDIMTNTDIMKATSCMRQFFGETFLAESFRKSGKTLTDGEYFGVLCPEINTKEIHDLIRYNAQGDYDGIAIKECLAKANSEDLFEHYVKLGQTSEESPEPATHEIPKEGSSNQASTQNPDLLNTPALHFRKGVCQSKIETNEFFQLKDDKERIETVQCLTKCANNFLYRIAVYLNNVVSQVRNSPSNESTSVFSMLVLFVPDPSQEFVTEKFYPELGKAGEKPSNVPITQAGKEYLVAYSKVYLALNTFVNDRLRKIINDLDQLDSQLFTLLQVYQDCARLDCTMGLNSTPFYNLIRSGAKDSYWKIQQTFKNDKESLSDWMNRQTGDWKNFCKAFVDEKNVL